MNLLKNKSDSSSKSTSTFSIREKTLLYFSAFIFTFFLNTTFFSRLLEVYPFASQNAGLLLSVTLSVYFVLLLLFNFFRWRPIFKTFLFLLVLISYAADLAMRKYGSIIDETMLLNIVQTNPHEAFDLVSFSDAIGFFLLFTFLIFFLIKVEIRWPASKKKWLSQVKVFFLTVAMMGLNGAIFGKSYASFFREHKILRYYVNPTSWLYASLKFSTLRSSSDNGELVKLGGDETFRHLSANPKREVIVLVVGETIRGDHVSLNGYPRKTFPRLAQERVVSFNNVTSCGTSTAISVPCMFSNLGQKNFSSESAQKRENLLDVLNHLHEIEILWRDNNSSSKGVAQRLMYEDFKNPKLNRVCDRECRDIGMLKGLKDFIQKSQKRDVFIVLHQMGNHGPAYYKRYPKEFEIFKPVCQTNEFGQCSQDQIINGYDNALLYTDYFLSQVIELLKLFPDDETAMLFVGDHGESLGEHGIYLHGMPYMFAPIEQKKTAMMMWFGGELEKKIDYKKLTSSLSLPYSHDNLFHTVLGLFEVQTELYDKDLDILSGVISEDKDD